MYGEFSFISLNKPADWARGLMVNLRPEGSGLAIPRENRHRVRSVLARESFAGPGPVWDFAVNPIGLLFGLDDRGIWSFDPQTKTGDTLLSHESSRFGPSTRIGVGNGFLCIADPEAKVPCMAFSLSNGQLLWTFTGIGEERFVPQAVAVDDTGYIYYYGLLGGSAKSGTGAQPVLLKLNDAGVLIETAAGDALDAIAQSGTAAPALAARGGTAYLLNPNHRVVTSFWPYRETGLPGAAGETVEPSALAIDENGHFYVSIYPETGRYADGGPAVVRIDPDLGEAERLQGFRGAANKLLASAGRIFVWHRAGALTVFEPAPHTSAYDGTGVIKGIFITPAIDSETEQLVWHKLTIDADIPSDTHIRISYTASDHREMVIGDRLIDLDRFLHDASIPVDDRLAATESIWSDPLLNPTDSLLQRTTGRYLWIKLELHGSEQHSPILNKIRLYYPRMSFLEYLPAVYQEDPASKDFLERFLSIFGTLYDGMESRIGQISAQFDVDHAEGDFLRWLAGWLALPVDETWSQKGLRNVIKLVPELYPLRGTRQGIERMVEAYTGEKPLIVEQFEIDSFAEQAELKDLLTGLYGGDPNCFSVLVRQECIRTPQQLAGLRRLLDNEKPAFTEVRLFVLQPWIFMDQHAYLGINTQLTALSELRLDGKSTIPFNTVLVDVGRDNRMDVHTRAGFDAMLR